MDPVPISTDADKRVTARAWSGAAAMKAEMAAWKSINRAAAVDPLCCAPEWTAAYIDAYVPAGDVFGWTFHDASTGEPVAIVPLRREPARKFYQVRRALFAQDGSFDSDYLDIPTRRGYELVVAEAFLDIAAAGAEMDAVVFSCMPESSPMFRALRLLLEYRQWPRREIRVACLCAPLAPTFDAYVSGLKSRMRSKVRSAVRAAEQEGASFSWCNDAASMPQHLEGLYRLHAMRWNEVGKVGSFLDEKRRDFFRGITEVYLPRNELRFARLEWGGRIVAYQFGVLAGKVYYQIQEGFDTSMKDARVGTALRGLVIRALIQEGATGYDFMAGASRHKAEWGGLPKPCITLAFATSGLRARLSYGLRQWLDRRARSTKAPEPPAAQSANAAKVEEAGPE